MSSRGLALSFFTFGSQHPGSTRMTTSINSKAQEFMDEQNWIKMEAKKNYRKSQCELSSMNDILTDQIYIILYAHVYGISTKKSLSCTGAEKITFPHHMHSYLRDSNRVIYSEREMGQWAVYSLVPKVL